MWRNLCFPARSEDLMDAAMSVVSRVHIKTRSVLDKKKAISKWTRALLEHCAKNGMYHTRPQSCTSR